MDALYKASLIEMNLETSVQQWQKRVVQNSLQEVFLILLWFYKKKITKLYGGYLSPQWNYKFRLFEPCPPNSEVLCKSNLIFILLLGTSPRHSELLTFCDLQFLNCSQGKLDLGTIERRGIIFNLVWGRGTVSFSLLAHFPMLMVLLYQDP